MPAPRELDAVEIRTIGSLLEKEQAPPEYYPLTLNALLAACNQKSNREPVLELSAAEVEDALERLSHDVLVWRSESARSTRWSHNVARRWGLDPARKAVLTVFLLRGPQTPGELRSRCERMHAFASVEDVEATLAVMAEPPEPLVAALPRRPGHKEVRWCHLVGGSPLPEETAPVAAAPERLADRVAVLEERVATLAERLELLLARLGE